MAGRERGGGGVGEGKAEEEGEVRREVTFESHQGRKREEHRSASRRSQDREFRSLSKNIFLVRSVQRKWLSGFSFEL